MMNTHEQAFQRAQIILKYLRNEASAAERAELEAWLAADSANRRLFDELADEQKLQEELRFFETISVPDAWEKVAARTESEPKVVPLRPQRRRWWMAAAAAVLVLGGSALLYRLSDKTVAPPPVAEAPAQKPALAPGGNKAVLTLADGAQVVLSGREDGEVARQGAARVVKSGSRLAYRTAGLPKAEATLYNTLTTPRGGEYQVELPDGSRVWLNAASSVRYPTAFTGKQRMVEITGEAYFEVAKNAALPFVVRVAGSEIKVLGTHFNVMAYADEKALETTLLEGSVQFAGGGKARLLRPGQQAQLANGQLKVAEVDAEEVVSWKNGMFHFENADLESVMKQLARWYDVEVVYQGSNLHDPIVGDIPRTSPLPEALKILELTSSAHFTIDGRKIIVKP
ncbi:FecR domain-containing protein [Paraflavisolibacter sp. H34]|uniref:FecR domain-containing protein n=1 Tax=Huijunlia imazamoxiresistens TaxID=3127457 RepID=UPI003015EFCE